MINRILIRIKVLQIVYSYYQNGNNDLKVAENELLFSLRKSYDLYHYFLLLIVDVTNLQRRILDARKNKYMPTEAELNPNTRLIDNRFAAQIAENEALRKYVAEQGLSWDNDEDFIKWYSTWSCRPNNTGNIWITKMIHTRQIRNSGASYSKTNLWQWSDRRLSAR